MTAERFLLWLLRLNAAVLLLAAPCALLPFTSMAWVHREVLGLGPLPDMPIIRYMGRSLSILYATYGLITLYITISWPRYREVVPLVALAPCSLWRRNAGCRSRRRDAVVVGRGRRATSGNNGSGDAGDLLESGPTSAMTERLRSFKNGHALANICPPAPWPFQVFVNDFASTPFIAK